MFRSDQRGVGTETDSYRSGDTQQQASPQEAQDELMNLMTIMYIAIQETLSDPEDMSSSYRKLRTTSPLNPRYGSSVLTLK